VRLYRVFGYHQVNQFDPFLMLDHFGDDNPANFLPAFPGTLIAALRPSPI
jgi:redox-sensitive bicupin YhaK (pirin superfamily)